MIFTTWPYVSAIYAVVVCLSVCLSVCVCLSHSDIESKRLNKGSHRMPNDSSGTRTGSFLWWCSNSLRSILYFFSVNVQLYFSVNVHLCYMYSVNGHLRVMCTVWTMFLPSLLVSVSGCMHSLLVYPQSVPVCRAHVSIFNRPPLLRRAQVACHVTSLQCIAITFHVIRSLENIFNGPDLNYC